MGSAVTCEEFKLFTRRNKKEALLPTEWVKRARFSF